jgi:hypothetical protein
VRPYLLGIPVIPATQEAEIRRIVVRSQSGQIVHETLSRKTLYKKRAGGVAQGEGPEFKPQYCKKTEKNHLKETKEQDDRLKHNSVNYHITVNGLNNPIKR